MKERTFYTINLDLTRIFILLAIFFGFLAYFFFLGRSTASKDKHIVSKPTTETKEIKPEAKTGISPEEKMAEVEAPKEKGTETIELKPKTEEAKNTTIPVVEIKDDSSKTLPPSKEQVVTQITPPAKQIQRRYVKKKNPKNEKLLNDDKTFYTIQLGAFSSQELANKFKENVLTKNKFGGKYIPMVQKNSDYFVVRVGRSNSKEELEKILQNLDPKTLSTSIIISNQKQ